MPDVNKYILNALVESKNKLSNDAVSHIKQYLISQLHSNGGFKDRAGKPDPYYSVFGYVLALVFDVELDIKKEKHFITSYFQNTKLDFIHAASLVRCLLIIKAIDYKYKGGVFTNKISDIKILYNTIQKKIQKSVFKESKQLLQIIESYKAKDFGYNQNQQNADNGNIYASFIAYTLFQDLGIKNQEILNDSFNDLQLVDGSYVNEPNSKSGVSTATAAGLIMNLGFSGSRISDSVNWLKSRWNNQGGFFAAEDLPIIDILSTSTVLLALKMAGENIDMYKTKCLDMVNLHWDNSGGFFGSVSDTKPDCEYTYYALLTLGLF